MKLTLSSELSRSEINMTHNGRELIWNSSPFDRTELSSDVDSFKQINDYWAKLTSEEQDEIFELYSQIRYILDDAQTLDQVTNDLQPLIQKLLDCYHDLDRIHDWCWFYSDLAVPHDIKDNVNFEEGGSSTADKTYLKSDYKRLVALAVAIRSLIPIWGEFIFRTKNECGTTYKEYYAVRLLYHSKIMNSHAIEKLTNYIMKQLPTDRSNAGAILGCISSDDLPPFMLARVLVRRLCVGDISGTNPSSTILTFIYKYIRQKNSNNRGSQKLGSSSNFNDNIREKFPETGGESDDGENKLSKLEGYKIQEELSRGDVQTIRYFLNNPNWVLKDVQPDLDIKLLNQSMESIQVLGSEIIDPVQLAILQWVLRPSISPEGLATVNKKGLLKAIAITQAVLWFRGHKEIAALCSAYSKQADDHKILTVEKGARIPRDLQEQIRTLFPFDRRSNGKSKQAKLNNPCIVAIDKIADGLSSREWTLTIPEPWLAELGSDVNNRRFAAPYDIKIKLANLIISLLQRRA